MSEDQLHQLASQYGIKTSYLDMCHCVKPASGESLLAVLKALDAPVNSIKDVSSAIRQQNMRHWQRPLEPVIVVWEGDMLIINIRLPHSMVKGPLIVSLNLENAEKRKYTIILDESLITNTTTVEGVKYSAVHLNISEKLPLGYHTLSIETPDINARSLLISAPVKAYTPPSLDEKIWGCFIPLYALHTRHSFGSGNYSDLKTLAGWTSGLGSHILGTLPLLPSFVDDIAGYSPYMPASRLFWNEFYLSIEQVPELAACPLAQSLLNSSDFQNAISQLRSSRYVDYKQELSLKRKILEVLTEDFFLRQPPRFLEFQTYIENRPEIEDYANFRAVCEAEGLYWQDWQPRMRDGSLKAGDFPQKAKEYYLYTQWLAEEQMQTLRDYTHRNNIMLYLDLPVGVHPCSYDTWRERHIFISDVTGGAPPDPVFTSGQNWHFPPLNPQKIRDDGYRYIINILRHQLKQAGMLRIDHIMNFHRLFCIPEGMQNSEGVYISYNAEELYAILTLESCRSHSVIIGEDLGMVPPEVRPMMEKHGIYRMYVGQFELIAENQLGKVPIKAVASLNTHDMFPFTSFWQGSDITERHNLKLINSIEMQQETNQRQEAKRNLVKTLQQAGNSTDNFQDSTGALKVVLNLLADSPAYALLVNLEDLWLEEQPQNVPGTERIHNWSHKARYSFEEFSQSNQIREILSSINQNRKAKRRVE